MGSFASPVVGAKASTSETVGNGVILWDASCCADVLVGGRTCVITDGDAEAARSCSSRLGVATGDGDDLVKVDLEGAWNGRVDGSAGWWSTLTVGNGKVASSKRRPLQTRRSVE
jgi:hypothetical protein